MFKNHLFFLFVFCMSLMAQDRPNIVWIISEDNSKHYLKLFDEHGAETPNIAKLAEDGVIFDRAFANAPVCSAARTTLISGIYGPHLGSHYHRNLKKVNMPKNSLMFPSYLKRAGYYTANNSKEDFNINKPEKVWHMTSPKATWRNRKKGQPFFYVQTIYDTHESRVHGISEKSVKNSKANLESITLQPNHPNTKAFKFTKLQYHNRIKTMDQKLGKIVKKLKEDGLYDETIIFYFSDHGGVLPGSKGYTYETGLHVPLVVRVPEKYQHLIAYKPGTRTKDFVEFVDFSATVLNIVGLPVPNEYHGKPFMGQGSVKKDITFGYANRFDEKHDFVRTVRKGRYKYMRSYQPFLVDGLNAFYRYRQYAYREWRELKEAGKLNSKTDFFFRKRTPEMLFDIDADPYEMNNLADDPRYKKILLTLRKELNDWQEEINDLSFYPEYYLIQNAFKNSEAFGKKQHDKLKRYKAIANLQLKPFSEAKAGIEKALNSQDPWERHWALMNSIYFANQAKSLEGLISKISKNDKTPINKVLAGVYITSTGGQFDDYREIAAKVSDANELLNIFDYFTLLTDVYGVDFKDLKTKAKSKITAHRTKHFNSK